MIKILIVDDEKTICDLIDINLSAAGYHCKAVQDGLVAIDLIEKEQETSLRSENVTQNRNDVYFANVQSYFHVQTDAFDIKE